MTEQRTQTKPLSMTGGPTASWLGKAGWLSFEVAQGPYFLMVNIFVFGPYFSNTVIGNPVLGQAYWGYIQAAAGVFIAALSPILGSLADATGARKRGISLFVATGCVASFGLWMASPNLMPYLPLVIVCLIVSAVVFEFAGVYHNAMLPTIASHSSVGTLSGAGYSASYVGGSVVFLIWLALFSLPDQPLFGLSQATHDHNRIVGPLVSVWFLIFLAPLLFFTPDIPRSALSVREATRTGLTNLAATFRKLPKYKNIAKFLVARLIYYDGLTASFSFIGIYAAGIFGWTTIQVGIFALITLNISAVGGVIGGRLDDRFGSKRIIFVAVTGFLISNIIGLSFTPDTAFYFFPADNFGIQLPIIGGMLIALGFESIAEQMFVAFAACGGVFAGPSLASSRTMLARLAPAHMTGEFFGLYTLTGKATAFLAPFTIGLVTQLSNNQRIGFAVIFVFLIVGLALMTFVKEERAEELD